MVVVEKEMVVVTDEQIVVVPVDGDGDGDPVLFVLGDIGDEHTMAV